MRIGFDMLALQSPHHGHGGIGRYRRHLVAALLARDDGHEYALYAHAALPAEGIPSAPNAQLRWLGGDKLTGPLEPIVESWKKMGKLQLTPQLIPNIKATIPLSLVP